MPSEIERVSPLLPDEDEEPSAIGLLNWPESSFMDEAPSEDAYYLGSLQRVDPRDHGAPETVSPVIGEAERARARRQEFEAIRPPLTPEQRELMARGAVRSFTDNATDLIPEIGWGGYLALSPWQALTNPDYRKSADEFRDGIAETIESGYGQLGLGASSDPAYKDGYLLGTLASLPGSLTQKSLKGVANARELNELKAQAFGSASPLAAVDGPADIYRKARNFFENSAADLDALPKRHLSVPWPGPELSGRPLVPRPTYDLGERDLKWNDGFRSELDEPVPEVSVEIPRSDLDDQTRTVLQDFLEKWRGFGPNSRTNSRNSPWTLEIGGREPIDIGNIGVEAWRKDVARRGGEILGHEIHYYILDEHGNRITDRHGKFIYGKIDGLARFPNGSYEITEVKNGRRARYRTNQLFKLPYVLSGDIELYGSSAREWNLNVGRFRDINKEGPWGQYRLYEGPQGAPAAVKQYNKALEKHNRR